MAQASSSEPMADRAVLHHRYQHPPVHEVILDVRLHERVDDNELRALRDRLGGEFDRVDEQTQVGLLMSFGPQGQAVEPQRREFAGWLFKTEPVGWVLRTTPDQFTLHVVRPGKWPSGEYVGWETIIDRFRRLREGLAEPYGSQGLKRVGLRYLNRMALPRGADIGQWLRIPIVPPAPLNGLHSFNIQHTWAHAGDQEDIGARINLVRIDIEEPTLARDHDGVMLDIDVFNLQVRNAPTWDAVMDWFDRAHRVENEVFENCITDQLRSLFDR